MLQRSASGAVEVTLEAKDEADPENLDKLVNIDIISMGVKVSVASVSLGLSEPARWLCLKASLPRMSAPSRSARAQSRSR